MTANDPLIARFARACGAHFPLDLQVDLGDGTILARGKVHQPFTLVGRSDSCDVTLTDLGVHFRHCWLQVIEGRVFCVDLGTRNGVVWPSGDVGSGWLEPLVSVGIGPFRLHLRSAPTGSATAQPGFDPLASDSGLEPSFPPVELAFHNGRRARDHWLMNRVITLIGRSGECKIHLNADDVAPYHCGIVLTREGPWVVDLSGRGVLVNGEWMRVAPLLPGVELRVSRFAMSTRWRRGTRAATHPTPPPTSFPTPPPTRNAPAVSSTGRRDASGPPSPPLTEIVPVPQLFAEDEVPIGGATFSQSTSGLPSSHIMCDAFRPGSHESHGSSAILVAGSASSLQPIPPSAQERIAENQPARADAIQPTFPATMALAPGLSVMMKQLGDIYDNTVEQLQRSVLLLVEVCGRLLPEQAPAVLRELTRIQELNAEIGKLQGDLARATLQQVIGATTGSYRAADTIDMRSAAAGMIPEMIQGRITALQDERQNRWTVLATLLGGQPEHDCRR